jgi:adenylyltransferase/sulfurtransferase
MAAKVRLTIVDPDHVDVSNLHRQILYRSDDIGLLKVQCAAQRLSSRFPRAAIRTVAARLDPSNALDLIAGHDVVIDGCDSFATKFLLNDTCLQLGIPLVHGAATGWTGQIMTVVGAHACYRCIFEAPPDGRTVTSCQNGGIVGAVCGVVGGWMAEEAERVLEGHPQLGGTLRVYDALTGAIRQLKPNRRSSCPAHIASEVATW